MTAHKTASQIAVESALENEGVAVAVSATLRRLRNIRRRKHASDWYVDMIYQKHARAPIEISDAYCFAWVDSMIHSGGIKLVSIEVGETPGPDKCSDENNAKLREIATPFSASFRGGYGDNDGVLEWGKPITVGPVSCAEKGPCPSKSAKKETLHAGSCPLEVGFTEPSRTWAHLRQEGLLARWPYGSDRIFLMVKAKSSLGVYGPGNPLHAVLGDC